MSMGPMPGPMPGTRTCQQIADEIQALENEEVLLVARDDVARIKLANAKSAYDKAVHDAAVAQMALMGNRNRQLALHGEANAQGC